MRKINRCGSRRTTLPVPLGISASPAWAGFFRSLLACTISLALTACASNAPQAQFLPWNLALTTGGAGSCDPGCSQQTAQTAVAAGEDRPATVPWKSSVMPSPPYEYQPYQGEHTQPTEAQPSM